MMMLMIVVIVMMMMIDIKYVFSSYHSEKHISYSELLLFTMSPQVKNSHANEETKAHKNKII